MMYEELYQYLLLYKQLPVPGIGTFSLERKPAESDFFNKRINAPVYKLSLQQSIAIPTTKLINWLANTFHISNQDADSRFNDFVNEMKNQVNNGGVINWNGVGVLSKGLGGEIKFKPTEEGLITEQPVTAAKVIRQHAEHMVRVGEDNKTSAEMVEMLNQPEEKKSYWWAYAVAIGLLGIIFLGWYFSEHGVDVSSTANNATFTPMEVGNTYQAIP